MSKKDEIIENYLTDNPDKKLPLEVMLSIMHDMYVRSEVLLAGPNPVQKSVIVWDDTEEFIQHYHPESMGIQLRLQAFEMAKSCAPYAHPKLTSTTNVVEHTFASDEFDGFEIEDSTPIASEAEV